MASHTKIDKKTTNNSVKKNHHRSLTTEQHEPHEQPGISQVKRVFFFAFTSAAVFQF